MRRSLSSLPGSVFVLLAAVLSGCAGSSSGNGLAAKTPDQIVAAARSAADGAATVRVAGSMMSAGVPVSIDMELVRGKGGRGRIALEGLSIEVVRVGSALYLMGNPAFYRRIAGPTAAHLLRGKWLKAVKSSVGDFSPLASLTQLDFLIDAALAGHGPLASGATTTLDGQEALAVKDLSRGGTLYVAATRSPYPLEVLGGSGGRLVFDRWNRPISLEAPLDAVNVKQLDRP